MPKIDNAQISEGGHDRLQAQSIQLNFSVKNSRTLEQMLTYPNLADYQENNWKSIAQTFNDNHQILLDYLKQNKLRYFGIHGTGDDGIKGIIDKPKSMVEVATFYDKRCSEKRLLQFYQAVVYASCYAFHAPKGGAPGGILLFDLENNGNNIAYKHEFLKPGAFTFPILSDSMNMRRLIRSQGKPSNLLLRAQFFLSEDFMKDRFVGIVGVEPYKEMEQVQSLGNSMDITLFNHRFFAQRTLSQILTLMKNRSDL